MKANNKVDLNSTQNLTAGGADTAATVEAIIAMVSYLQSEAQQHSPIAAYFLGMCRFSLLQSKTKRS